MTRISESSGRVAAVALCWLCRAAAAHEPDGPQGSMIVDWSAPEISRVSASLYGDAFGMEASVKMGPPTVEMVDGKECLVGSYLMFDVDDRFAFDIDEPVELELTLDTRQTTGFYVGYDRNAAAEALLEIEFDDDEQGLRTERVLLDRARFANRGEGSSDFILAGRSAYWPGAADADHRIAVCGMRLHRSNRTPDRRPSATIELRIVDESGEPTPARVGIYDFTGRMPLPSDAALEIRRYDDVTRQLYLRARPWGVSPWPHPNRHVFFVDGRYEAQLPAGPYRVIISKGPEYLLRDFIVDLAEGQTRTLSIRAGRWTDMPAAGWYSGDGHIHMPRAREDDASILTMMRAEDLHVSNLLQMGNPAEVHFRQYAFGRSGRHVGGRHALVPGVEDPRTAVLGHTISLNIRELMRDAGNYLRYDDVFAGYREQGGLSGFAHLSSQIFNVHRGLALTVPLGVVDFVEVLQDGELDTELWYQYLNIGFRLTPLAGSDYPYLSIPGGERSYVHLGDDTFSADRWYEGLRAGRTFVTSGPMLTFSVDGSLPGATIESAGEVAIRARAALNPALDALDRLELVAHGEVIAVARDDDGDNDIRLEQSLPLRHGVWLAARAYGRQQVAAHTAPIYVDVDGSGTHSDTKAPAIIESLVAELNRLKRVEVDKDAELEGWAVAVPLERMLEEQREQLLRSAEAAARVYARRLVEIESHE